MFKIILIFLLVTVNCALAQLWVQQPTSTFFTGYSVSAVNNNVCWICGSSGRVIRTTNGGINWDVRTVTGAPTLYNIFGVDSFDAFCTGGTSGNIYRTTNGGLNWTLVFNQNTYINSIWMTSSQNGIMMGDPAGGRWTLYRTTNGGFSWDSAGLRLPSLAGEFGWNNSMMVIGTNIWFIGGGIHNNNRVYYSSNSGFNWIIQTAQMPYYNPVYGHIWFNSPSLGVGYAATTDSSSSFRTSNGGTIWNTSSIGSVGSNIPIMTFTGYGTNFWRTVYGGGIDRTISKSTDNGITFFQQYISTNQLAHIQCARNGTVAWAVSTNGAVIKGNLAPPPAPVHLSPANGATGQPLTPTLDWSDVQGPLLYHLQISTDSNFTTFIFRDSGLVVSQYAVGSGLLQNNITYYWRIRGKSAGDIGSWSTVWRFTTGFVGINTYNSEIPKNFQLYDAYPNPFNPSANIKFDIPKASHVKLIIYNISGKVAANVIDESMEPGRYSIIWNAENFASGIYFYSVIAGDFQDTRKMVLVK